MAIAGSEAFLHCIDQAHRAAGSLGEEGGAKVLWEHVQLAPEPPAKEGLYHPYVPLLHPHGVGQIAAQEEGSLVVGPEGDSASGVYGGQGGVGLQVPGMDALGNKGVLPDVVGLGKALLHVTPTADEMESYVSLFAFMKKGCSWLHRLHR